MTASEVIKKVKECVIRSELCYIDCSKCEVAISSNEIITALDEALDLLEKQEKAEKVANKLAKLLGDEEETDKAIEQFKWERDTAIHQLEEIGKGFGEKMDDVKALVDAKAEGRIIELPVPIGSEHYYIARDKRRGIKKVKVCGIWTSCNPTCNHMLIADVEGTFSTQCVFDEIGTRFFATREEAEKCLKELRGEEWSKLN